MKKPNKSQFLTIPFQLKVEKPWGYELILTQANLPYTGKILHLKKGARFSLQYHDQKMESLTLLKGKALLIIENKKGKIREVEMEKGKGYLIYPFQKHRVCGLTSCDVLETSTPEKGNTFRLEDDYSRGVETESKRSQERKMKT